VERDTTDTDDAPDSEASGDDLFAPVPGFRFAGVHGGIKKDGLDLGAIVAHELVPTAAVFTRNRVRAAPVTLSAERVKSGKAQAVLVNSGNANASTGKGGRKAAEVTSAAFAEAVGVDVGRVLVCSTGVIGVPLPTERMVEAMPSLVGALDPDGAATFAEAILTTDRGTKVARRTFRHGSRDCVVLAIAKGAGMIHPDMATTLAFLLTDAPVKRGFLRKALRGATEQTFNRISVDGDTSTNDTIVAMASGAAGGKKIDAEHRSARRLGDALRDVLEEVALMIVADGEGAQHVATVRVTGAPDDAGAQRVAETIATSPLVKTAMHGRDPNWGRILAAAGRAGVAFDPDRAEVSIGEVMVYRRGENLMDGETEAKATEVMKAPRYEIRVHLRAGKAKGWYWTCDLGHAYVDVNAMYRS